MVVGLPVSRRTPIDGGSNQVKIRQLLASETGYLLMSSWSCRGTKTWDRVKLGDWKVSCQEGFLQRGKKDNLPSKLRGRNNLIGILKLFVVYDVR